MSQFYFSVAENVSVVLVHRASFVNLPTICAIFQIKSQNARDPITALVLKESVSALSLISAKIARAVMIIAPALDLISWFVWRHFYKASCRLLPATLDY